MLKMWRLLVLLLMLMLVAIVMADGENVVVAYCLQTGLRTYNQVSVLMLLVVVLVLMPAMGWC